MDTRIEKSKRRVLVGGLLGVVPVRHHRIPQIIPSTNLEVEEVTMSMPNPKRLAILAIFLASLTARTYAGTYSGGTGERNDPYQIASAEDVTELSLNGYDWDNHFLLTEDINLDPKLEGRKSFNFAVIAPDQTIYFPNNIYHPRAYFTGTFDGNGHTIQNLTIAGGNKDFCGFFGYIWEGAEVRNLGCPHRSCSDNQALLTTV